ncbi:hypothetical protein Acsp03_40630 [Actinomadura sp. NBRC 104412]|uniref:hypothetical protein n=1 Tax=Actinomadura sp. NBRC 104412 TaxID=3032203 RepID=UPI0024A12F82|nr:hypothetical protein [Actinomadura sp. NBRC 104412]GLZ06597.1 hypothetical protein Acsp03_40630 [Actinomadura sp. NBRC 104412]
MDPARRVYEARVLIIPHGPSALAAEAEMRELGLDGVMSLHPGDDAHGSAGLRVRPLSNDGWARPAPVDRVGDAVAGADIVVLFAADLAEVDTAACHAAADAARAEGALIAALIVRPDATGGTAADTTGGATDGTMGGTAAMAALRAAADMVVIVRGPGSASAFLDVLRGGRRETATVS